MFARLPRDARELFPSGHMTFEVDSVKQLSFF